MKKRWLAMLLAVVLCLSLLPMGALADEASDAALALAEQAVAAALAQEESPAVEPTPAPGPEDMGFDTLPGPDDLPDPTGGDTGECPEPATGSDTEPVAVEPPPEEVAEPELHGATTLPSNLYLVQQTNETCTLASAVMMLRARMYLSGNNAWSSITESGVRSTAWLEGSGLYYNWTYTISGNKMTVSHTNVSGMTVASLKALLNSHPEGIVIYVTSIPHAILVTDYEGDTFYGADPASGNYSGRRKLSETWLATKVGNQSSILNAIKEYWYISSYSISANKYTVTFDANGGTCSETKRSVTPGDAVGPLPTPTRSGYTFVGWSTRLGWDFSSSETITENTTLYARWERNGNVGVKITFDANGGVLPGAIATYTADGVNRGRGGEELIIYDESDVEVYTNKWGRELAVDASGRITAIREVRDEMELFVPNGGMIISGQTNSGIGGIEFTSQASVGQYVGYNYATRVVSLYDSYDAYLAEQKYVASGAGAGTLPTPTREGYIFDGWYTSGNGGSKVTDSTAISAPTTLYAHWSARATSGSCGDDLWWNYYADEQTLVIDGSGAMYDYPENDAPWYGFRGIIKEILISGKVTSIGAYAFVFCDQVTSITLPSTVTSIGESAFYCCSSLTSIVIPEGVTKIAHSTFYDCMSLASVMIPKSVTRIEGGNFNRRYDSVKLHIYYGMRNGGTKDDWDSVDVVDSLNDVLKNATFHFGEAARSGACGENVQWHLVEALAEGYELIIEGDGEMYDYEAGTAPWYALRDEITVVRVTGNVTTVGAYAFYRMPELVVAYLEDVTRINGGAFKDSGVQVIEISNELLYLGNSAFSGDELTSVVYHCGGDGESMDWMRAGTGNDALTAPGVEWQYLITVTLDAGGGGLDHADIFDIEAGTSFSMYNGGLPVPTREGYTFDGWYYANGVKVTEDTIIRTSCTLYAHWTKQEDEPDPATAQLTVTDAAVFKGKEVTLSVEISDNPGVAYMSFGVSYDSAKLQFVRAEGDGLTGWTENLSGGGSAVWYSDKNTVSNGSVLKMTFKALDSAADGTVQVSLTKATAFDADEHEVSLAVKAGTVTITSRVPGDVNGDGKLDGRDLVRLAQHFAGYSVKINEANADVNGDGRLDGRDLVRLAQYFAGYAVNLK